MTQDEQTIDAAIVARVTGGDAAAYGELMERYEPKLMRYVTYLLRDDAAAADVVQDTFIKTYQNLRGYKPAYKFSSWIYRIAHNEAMNSIRGAKHAAGGDIDSMPELAYDARLSEKFDADILKTDVQACLAELPAKYREVIQLVYFEDMKYEDAADILHTPTSTIGVWLRRAKEKLRVICERKGTTHE